MARQKFEQALIDATAKLDSYNFSTILEELYFERLPLEEVIDHIICSFSESDQIQLYNAFNELTYDQQAEYFYDRYGVVWYEQRTLYMGHIYINYDKPENRNANKPYRFVKDDEKIKNK